MWIFFLFQNRHHANQSWWAVLLLPADQYSTRVDGHFEAVYKGSNSYTAQRCPGLVGCVSDTSFCCAIIVVCVYLLLQTSCLCRQFSSKPICASLGFCIVPLVLEDTSLNCCYVLLHSYFRAMAKGEMPPVKERLEMPVATQKTDTGLTPGLLKVLNKQVSPQLVSLRLQSAGSELWRNTGTEHNPHS